MQMTCESCAAKVRAALQGKPGEREHAEVHTHTEAATVTPACVYLTVSLWQIKYKMFTALMEYTRGSFLVHF